MNITVKNKQDIIDNIIEYELGIQLEKDVLETIKEFQHYKKVDKRFIDALTAKGYWAYILKEKYSSKLVIRKKIENPQHSKKDYMQFTLYNSFIGAADPISWEKIKDQFVRYGYSEQLENSKKMLNAFEKDVEKFKELYELVNMANFSCLDLWRIKSELQQALNYLTKK